MRTFCMGLTLLGLLAAGGCSDLRYSKTGELWAESEAHFDSGSYADTIEYYDELIRRDEENARAYLMRGVAHERVGEGGKALRDYAKAASLGESRALFYSANLNLVSGNSAAAEDDLTRLRDMDLGGRDKVIHLTLVGTLRLVQGQHRMAAQNFSRAAESGRSFSDPGTRRHVADANYNAAHAYYRLGDFHRAYDHMIAYAGGSTPGPVDEQQLLDAPLATVSEQDYYLLGLLAYLAGDFDAADVHLSRADAGLVAQAAEVLDDPSFGAAAREGLK